MASIHPKTADPAPSPGAAPVAADESRGHRLARHRHRARLYTSAVSLVALLIVLIVLIAKNTGAVKLDWAVGSTHASLVWIILASTVIGWLLGIATAAVFRYRTRRP